MTTTQTPVDALMALVKELTVGQRRYLGPDEVERRLVAIEASARALAAIPEAHSNADLAAKARSFAESHDSVAEVILATSSTFVSLNRAGLAKNTADLLRQVAVALESPIAQQAGGVPAGFVLVPVEPTDEMELAAENDYEQRGETFPDWKAKWRAMIAASPSPSAVQPLSEAQRVPLTGAERASLWMRANLGSSLTDAYIAGLEDAERAHGIVTKEST